MTETEPLATVFPPVPKTVWQVGDPEIESLLGTTEDGSILVEREGGPVTRGPRIALGCGLYGVEFRVSAERADLPPDLIVGRAQVVAAGGLELAGAEISAGQLARETTGMYQGARLDVVVEQRAEDVEFLLGSTGATPLRLRGFKLIPRPGRIWFPQGLDYEPGTWEIRPDRSAVCGGPGTISARGISLAAGDHRLGVKLRPPAGVPRGVIAGIRVTGRVAGEGSKRETIAADPAVTAEAMLANHGIPDAKLRFRLGQVTQDVAVEVEAVTSGLIVQWVRLASADEAVWHHYYNLGGINSVLGQPVGGLEPIGPSFSGRMGACRRFEGGAIVWTIEDGPCQVTGEIARQYEALGEASGRLGFPTGRPRREWLPSGEEETRQEFEGGMLWAAEPPA